MSLVTTAMWKRSRIALHKESTNAVFPEPTGPPTPTRKVSRFAVIQSSSTTPQRGTAPATRTRGTWSRRSFGDETAGRRALYFMGVRSVVVVAAFILCPLTGCPGGADLDDTERFKALQAGTTGSAGA